MSDSSPPQGLQPTRLLRPWNFQGGGLEWVATAFSHHHHTIGLFPAVILTWHIIFNYPKILNYTKRQKTQHEYTVSIRLVSFFHTCCCCLVTNSFDFCDPMDYIVLQAPLSMGFPRQEYWNGLPFSSPGDLPYAETEPMFPALAGRFLTAEPPEEPFLILSWSDRKQFVQNSCNYDVLNNMHIDIHNYIYLYASVCYTSIE